MSTLQYASDITPSASAVIDLYASAGLNRPISDAQRIADMYAHSNLILTAWDGSKLVGVARSLTDFRYCCYLSDLAIEKSFQKQGIGKKLIELTREKLGPECMLLLLSAPNAMGYYPKVGFYLLENAFMIPRQS